MRAAFGTTRHRPIHPLHVVLLAATIPLFLGVLLSDLAYASSYELQWKNFASWLIIGGLVFGGFALLSALIGLFRAGRRGRRTISFVLLLAAWILGVINALVHAKDAWASMPEALILSAIVAVLAVAATGFGFSTRRAGAVE
jgi:uncharacterized membrane protein